MAFIKPLITCLVLLALVGCAELKPSQPASTIIERAHTGGSIVAFNTASTLLASGGWEGQIRLWRLPQATAVAGWSAHGDSVNGIKFIGDTHLVSAGYDGRIALWDLQGTLLGQTQTPSPITHMVADDQHQLMITGHADGALRVWGLPDLGLIKEYFLHHGEVRAVAWHPASQQFASSGTDGRVFTGTLAAAPVELPAPPSDAWTLAFSPDGRTLTGGGWFKLFRWDVASKALQILPTEHRGIIKSLLYNRDGQTLASISRQTDSAVYFLDARNGAVVRRFQPHDLCGADISISADGHYLATTSDDASVRLWDLHAPPVDALPP